MPYAISGEHISLAYARNTRSTIEKHNGHDCDLQATWVLSHLIPCLLYNRPIDFK